MMPAVPRSPDPLTLARRLAVVMSGGVAAISALVWGPRGLLAAVVGTGLSLINVWALGRMATRAVAAVGVVGPQAATAQLSGALGAKTTILLVSVWMVTRGGQMEILPLALGLLVSVFSLLGAGLWSAASAREE